ncbi:MAG: hypothetical protein ORO03_05080, partial [Alphaproteobacteria bacterium]|nr:hypothetical protein [Alphaproteobacteria bacterium]
ILSNNAGGDATLTSNTISITPQNLVPIITTITAVNTLVTINWTSSYGAQSYNLYRATTNPFIAGVANLLISSITQTSISTDNTTLNNSLYYYVVTAVDASANISLQSNWASIQIVPDQATMLISSVTQTEVYLDWVVPARGASSYVIYRDTSNLVSRASGTQFTTSNNKFIDTTAMQGVNYFYIVYSKNDSGFSINPTNIIQASLSAPQVAPSPLIDDPTLLVASINSLKQVELSWQTSSKATFYNIYRSLTSPVSTITVLSVSSINSYIDKNVVSGGKYFYVVKAGNSLALSTGTSNEVSITLAPSEATNLVASLNNVGNVSLSWIGANGATSYKIFKSTNNIINTNR